MDEQPHHVGYSVDVRFLVGLGAVFGKFGFSEQARDLGFCGRTQTAVRVIRIGNEPHHHGNAFDQLGKA